MVITKSISPAVRRAADVLERIQDTIQHDNGTKANLKRAMTGEPRHQRVVYPFILRYLSENEEKYNLDQWLLISGFLAYYPQNINVENQLNFGHSAHQLSASNSSGGTERRFRALLETSLEDLKSPLTAIVRLMKSKNISINYPQLLADLCYWDHPDQYIQDRWARAFWNASSATSKDTEESSNDVTDT